MKDQPILYHRKSGIIFKWVEEIGSYEPIYHNVKINEDGEFIGDEIKKGTIFYDFITFIRYSSMVTDKRTGKKAYGKFEIYQWAIAFNVIKLCMALKSDKCLTSISRQAGKSYSAHKILAFIVIFMPNYIYVPEDRFYVIFCSPKKDLTVDHMRKIQPDLDRGVELFNKLHPNSPIVTGGNDKTIKAKELDKEFDRILNGEKIHYSQIVGLSLQESVVNAGYTAHLLFVDEAQEVNNSSFLEQIQPFTTRTGGISYVLGTTLPDDSNLLYSYYKDKAIPDNLKIIYTWEDVYELKALVNNEEGEKYKRSVEKEITNYGKNSDYVLTQYYCSFKIRGTRFITMEDLERNNILSGGNINKDLKSIQVKKELERNFVYRIGAYDPALTLDYAAITTGISTKMGNINQFKTIMKDCIILNKDNPNMSSSELLDRVADICEYNNLDMLIIDSTAAQIDRAYMLVCKLRERGIDTLVIPFNYAGNNKQMMMKYFEDSMSNQNLKLPNERCREHSEDYDELLKELLYFQRLPKSNGNVEYKAPEGASFHDDCVMSIAMLNYCCKYVYDCQTRKKEAMLGSGIKYKLRLYKNKNNLDPNYEEQEDTNKNNRMSYLFL